MSRQFKLGISVFPWGLLLALGVCLSGFATAAETAATGKTAGAIDPKADEVLGKVSDLVRNAKSFSLDLDMAMITRMQGVKQEMQSSYAVAVQRPNRFAILLKEGMMGMTTISDGTKLYTCIPMLKRYTETEAPDDLDTSKTGSKPEMSAMGGIGGIGYIGPLLAPDPRESFLEGVTTATYAGIEKLESGECHHLKFVQGQFDWEMWVDVGQQPLVRKLVIDMTKTISQSFAQAQQQEGTGEMLKNMTMTMVLEFKGWTLNPDLPATRFTFVPPEGVKKAESLFDNMGVAEETNPLIGKPAPTFKLDSLDGGQISLDDTKGKRIVILDFWASWCGPCTKALPLLAEVAKEYQDKGVVLYAVNQKENPATIKNFLKDKNLAVTVALDAKGEVGALYDVQGIPQTVIIDTQGVVQAVHVGLLPNLKRQLSGELDKILAGKNLTPTGPKKEEPTTLKGLASVWSLAGRWNGIAADPGRGGVYVLANDGTCARVNVEGQVVRQFKMQTAGSTLRAANLMGDKGCELLTFGTWSESVRASDTNGTTLWTYTDGPGVDDVWAADLNGDGFDEVIVGYNGAGGVHAVDNQGKRLWTYDKIGNVWHVCAGDLNGDDEVEVATTSAEGKVYVFDAEGNKLRDIRPACYANMVRMTSPSASDKALMLFVGGTSSERNLVGIGLNAEGIEKWRTHFETGSGGTLDSAQAAPGAPWMAVLVRGLGLRVIDVNTGKIIAEANGIKGRPANVAWMAMPPQQEPLLLITTGRELIAYRIIKTP